jgi:hypothetical protein
MVAGDGGNRMADQILDDEDRAALASEFDAFHRGMNAALRLLERETPLAVGSIEKLRTLIRSVESRGAAYHASMAEQHRSLAEYVIRPELKAEHLRRAEEHEREARR